MKLILDATAVEKLLGGDTELEIELRQSVAAQFAKHHLKPLINSAEVKAIAESIKTQAIGAATKTLTETIANVKTKSWGTTEYSLKPEIISMIQDEVHDQLKVVIASEIKNALEVYSTIDTIGKAVNARIDEQIKYEIKSQVDAKMAAIRASLG